MRSGRTISQWQPPFSVNEIPPKQNAKTIPHPVYLHQNGKPDISKGEHFGLSGYSFVGKAKVDQKKNHCRQRQPCTIDAWNRMSGNKHGQREKADRHHTPPHQCRSRHVINKSTRPRQYHNTPRTGSCSHHHALSCGRNTPPRRITPASIPHSHTVKNRNAVGQTTRPTSHITP